jgi:Zn-finger nucleic acid-binding protein
MAVKKKLNVKAFIRDFVRGLPREEMEKEHSLSDSGIMRVVTILTKKGALAKADLKQRRRNLKIRLAAARIWKARKRLRKGVPVDLDTGLVLHCPTCGASVKRDAQTCKYCRVALDFSLKGINTHCRHCYQRIPHNSNYCLRCAKSVGDGAGKRALRGDMECPRCGIPLSERLIGEYQIVMCDDCAGLFVSHETFDMMRDTAPRFPESTDWPAGSKLKPNPSAALSYVECPVCSEKMKRKDFAGVSGILVDVCVTHGIWFDVDQLDHVMTFIGRGGLSLPDAEELRPVKMEERFKVTYQLVKELPSIPTEEPKDELSEDILIVSSLVGLTLICLWFFHFIVPLFV